TGAKVEKRIAQVEASVARYLDALERADHEESDVAEARAGRLKEKIAGLKRQMQLLKEMGKKVEASPEKQVSLTDPGANRFAVCRATRAPWQRAAEALVWLAITYKSPSIPSTI